MTEQRRAELKAFSSLAKLCSLAGDLYSERKALWLYEDGRAVIPLVWVRAFEETGSIIAACEQTSAFIRMKLFEPRP